MAFKVAARSAVFFIRPMNAQSHSYWVASKGRTEGSHSVKHFVSCCLDIATTPCLCFFSSCPYGACKEGLSSRLLGPPHQRTISSVLDSLCSTFLMMWPDQL